MKNFIHEQTRTNEAIYNVYKMFLKEEKLTTWLCDVAKVSEGRYQIQLVQDTFQMDSSDSRLIDQTKDQQLIIQWHDALRGFDSMLEINFMKCASQTKYCTEIHVVHKDIPPKWQSLYQQFWKEALDALRYYYNYDWVIEDKDLSRTKLTGRVL